MSDVKRYVVSHGELMDFETLKVSCVDRLVDAADYYALLAERDQLRAELAEYQADPSYVTACETIRKLRAELEAIRGQQPDAVSVPRELAQEALEMAIDDAEEHQRSPCFNPTRQRVLDAQVEQWRDLLSTKNAEEGE